jgi:hypothetical protein
MATQIKNPEWIKFKDKIVNLLGVFSEESDKIYFPEENDIFDLHVEDCVVHPVFSKKSNNNLSLFYDFSLCNIEIRTLSFTLYGDTARIDFTLKNQK